MTDLELEEEIERQQRLDGPYTITLAPNEWQQIIAALRRGPEQDDKEIGEFQQRVYELCEKFYPEVDGAGSDTGDWRDFTFAEIRQTLNHLAEREHFRFSHDNLHELWFDENVSPHAAVTIASREELDATIDEAALKSRA